MKLLTFDGEVHALADVSAHVVADFAQVVATILLQHMFDEQWASLQQLHPRSWVQHDGLELRNSRTWGTQRRKKGKKKKWITWFYTSIIRWFCTGSVKLSSLFPHKTVQIVTEIIFYAKGRHIIIDFDWLITVTLYSMFWKQNLFEDVLALQKLFACG